MRLASTHDTTINNGPDVKPLSKGVLVVAEQTASGPYTYTSTSRGDDIRVVALLCDGDAEGL